MGGRTQILVSELVEQDDVRFFAQRAVEVEIFVHAFADFHLARRNARQAARNSLEIGSAFRFYPADRDALTGVVHPARVLEQAARLSSAGGAGDVHD